MFISVFCDVNFILRPAILEVTGCWGHAPCSGEKMNVSCHVLSFPGKMFRSMFGNANWLKPFRIHLQRLEVRLILCKSPTTESSGCCYHEEEERDSGQQAPLFSTLESFWKSLWRMVCVNTASCSSGALWSLHTPGPPSIPNMYLLILYYMLSNFLSLHIFWKE